MAVAPLFVASMTDLKLGLRLQGVRAGSEGASIIDRAVRQARVYLYQRLGMSIVSSMLAQAEVDNPTTEAQIRRTACSLVEVEVVRRDLLDLMPVLIADDSGDAQQIYNAEGVWRQIDPEEMRHVLRRAEARIEELIELILSEDALGEDSALRIFSGGRSPDTRRFPGGTAHPGIGVFEGNFEEGYPHGNGNVPVRFELPPEDA